MNSSADVLEADVVPKDLTVLKGRETTRYTCGLSGFEFDVHVRPRRGIGATRQASPSGGMAVCRSQKDISIGCVENTIKMSDACVTSREREINIYGRTQRVPHVIIRDFKTLGDFRAAPVDAKILV